MVKPPFKEYQIKISSCVAKVRKFNNPRIPDPDPNQSVQFFRDIDSVLTQTDLSPETDCPYLALM